MKALSILYIASGLLLSCLAVPLILGRVPPNHIYGFRVRATLRDRKLWYAVNRYAAWRLLVVGLADAATAVVVAQVPGIGIDTYALLCLTVVATGLVVVLIQSFLYLKMLS